MPFFMKNRCLSIILVSSLLGSGCSSTDSANQVGGKLIGGATGALLGAQFGKGKGQLVGVGIGALLGAHVGGLVGSKMDEQDKQLANQAAQKTLESVPDNKPTTWKNPNNQHKGTFKVVKTEENKATNKVCRDYVHTVVIDGQEEKIHGRACRDVRDPKAMWVNKG